MTDDYVAPTEDFGTPIPPIEEPKSQGSKIWIILVVVLVALCCCCVVSIAVTYFWLGDALMESLGVYLLAPALLP
jgi:hypothetical protein